MTFDSSFYSEEFITDNQGTLYELPYWFCSDTCITRALETYVDKRFHSGRTAYQDPDLPDHHIEEFVDDWNQKFLFAYGQAMVKLRLRALGEFSTYVDKHNAEIDKEEEKIRAAVEKERRQLEADRQKKLDQARREELQQQERDKREARQALFDGIRLEDRERTIQLQQQREADRQEDRTERKRLEAWHDETREWRTEDRGWRIEDREWQLQQRERSEKQRQENDTRESFEQTFEQAGTDNQEYDSSDLFTPKPIPPRLRFQHMHILGPTGSGKTTLLQHLILKDFKDYGADAAHVIIDPKGAMTDRLIRLKQFDDSWADRLVILDPLDRPAFNIFNAQGQNPTQLISNIAYIFASHDQSLSGNQGTCLSFCASLLFRIPGANLRTLIELLEDRKDDPRFTSAINSLSDDQDWALKRFFQRDYYTTYEANRQQIKTRINTILTEENLASMFNSRT